MPTPQEVVNQIVRRIQYRTHGRVRRLEVEYGDQSVVIHGKASTYYTKQLAQHAAFEVAAGQAVVNAIEVG